MPQMDGLESTRRIRSLSIPSQEQPFIVALTADAFVQNNQDCLRSGMNDVLTKPIDRDSLDGTLYKYYLLAMERKASAASSPLTLGSKGPH